MSNSLKLLAMLAIGGLLGYFAGNRQELAHSSLLVVQQEALERQSKAIGQLKTDLGVKETQVTTQQAAFEQLQQTLKSQESQVQELKRQLAFFERIMRPTSQQVGVVIDNLTLQETSIPGRFHYRLSLTQPAKQRELFRGQVQIRVEGSLENQAKTLSGRDLGMTVGDWRYALRYFQLLEGNWQLPPGFVPDRVRITINKEGRQPAQELMAEWGDLLKPSMATPAAVTAAEE
ncbi:DUF6776 family protein [Aeromonas cavernicola]|uniref:Uncharacterized protein n=1 Tax=Aeromonas cavernicola TaxID=1006623 RepID=A0A2H9U5J2_9GAMM|nr:DUF6776 family protein [Aeromonas cavernicola]PJG59315.1 hypothetical protein CUC53_07900 [Aeromonas cavernicola]